MATDPAIPTWMFLCGSCGHPMVMEHIHPIGNRSRICLDCRHVRHDFVVGTRDMNRPVKLFRNHPDDRPPTIDGVKIP